MRRLTILLLALLTALTIAATRPAPAQASDSAAVTVNLKDGTDIFKFAFHIVRTTQDVVDETNAAFAYATCTDCTTVAVAFQIVLVFSDPSTITPTNLAIAMNVDCVSCDTFASAYQWVSTTGGPVVFTPEGQKRLNELRKQIRDLLRSDLPFDQLQAELDQIADEISDILKTELVSVGPGQTDNGESGGNGGEETTTPSETTPSETTPSDTTTTETTTTEPSAETTTTTETTTTP